MGRILVIDDDPDALALVQTHLKNDGHVIVTAKDAFEGLDMLDKSRFDLLITDVNMPFKSGFQFVKELKRSIRHQFLPVIFLTARGSKMDIMEGLKRGGDDYIVKPFDKESLLQKVRKHFDPNKATAAEPQQIIPKDGPERQGLALINVPAELVKVLDLGIEIETKFPLEREQIIKFRVPFLFSNGIEHDEFRVQAASTENGLTKAFLVFNGLPHEQKAKLSELLKKTF